MRRFLPAAAVLVLAGCAYLGGPLPPLANVPPRVTDLAAVERGTNVIVQFTVPQKTTEGLPMKQPPKVDLRIGPGPVPFSEEAWAAQAKPVPQPSTPAVFARYEVPAKEWIGREIVIGVRIVGANGKEAGWVFKVLPVVPPPEVPRDVQGEVLHPGPGASALRLTWKAAAGHFRVLRATADSDRFDIVATVNVPTWTDTHVDAGARYRYLVQSFVPQGENGEAQSDLSAPLAVTVDAPPPQAPEGLRAVAAPATIELAWDANGEPSVSGYRIYRAVAGGQLQKVGETGAVPTYSDRDVEHGKTYRYAVTAVDGSGKESTQSAAVEISLP